MLADAGMKGPLIIECLILLKSLKFEIYRFKSESFFYSEKPFPLEELSVTMYMILCKKCGKKWNATNEKEVEEMVDIYPCGCSKDEREFERKKIG
jgi:hypothetical protein